jgi:hypothetical protein
MGDVVEVIVLAPASAREAASMAPCAVRDSLPPACGVV